MSGGFSNPIIGGGGGLVYPSIHSPNYVPGVSGWTVNKDGSAEFNNLGIRGTFTGTDFDINADGAFFYSGTPAFGNLTLAITNPNASGVDQFGNVYSPGGISIIALAGLANMLNLADTSGNTLVNIDSGGNIQAQTITVDSVNVAGGDLINDWISPLPIGILNYGFKAIGGTAWPSTAIGTTEVALFELDTVVPANHMAEFSMDATIINVNTGPCSAHIHLRYTTDGSTPTTSSAQATMRASRVETTATDAHIGPLNCVFGPYASDTLLRCLVSGHAGANSYQFKNDDFIRIKVYDFGEFPSGVNNLNVLGSGSSGGGSARNYTKTYFATATDSYYGSQANSNPNGRRSHNSSCYQGAYSGGLSVNGDQYSFISFDHATIASDLSGASINSVKLRLTNLHSWYNSGMYAIVGYGTAGSYGDPFVPGAGTHFDQTSYFIAEGATLTKDITGAGIGTAFQSGGATAIAIGRSADRTTAGDLNNYGYFFGFSSTDHTHCPALIINYTK